MGAYREGLVRKDKSDNIDTDGNHAPNGIVGPHREKEVSYYTIKEIWSPMQMVNLCWTSLSIAN